MKIKTIGYASIRWLDGQKTLNVTWEEKKGMSQVGAAVELNLPADHREVVRALRELADKIEDFAAK